MTDRAVSSALNYVLSLGIAALLTTGLLMAGGDFVSDRQEQVVRSELEVIGQQVAADIHRADRLATAGRGSPTVRLNQTIPERITGSAYQITLDAGDAELELQSTDPQVFVRVQLQTAAGLRDSAASGGVVVVTYHAGADELEVGNG